MGAIAQRDLRTQNPHSVINVDSINAFILNQDKNEFQANYKGAMNESMSVGTT